MAGAFSGRRQRPQVEDDQYVPAVCRSQSDWSASERKETETFDEVEEQQLVAEVQRNVPLVRIINRVSTPARLGKGQGAKEIGHNLARERPKFGHNLVRIRHKIGHSLERE